MEVVRGGSGMAMLFRGRDSGFWEATAWGLLELQGPQLVRQAFP